MDSNVFIGVIAGGLGGSLLARPSRVMGTLLGSLAGGLLGFAISKRFQLPSSSGTNSSAALLSNKGTPVLLKSRSSDLTNFPVDVYQYADGTVRAVASDDPTSFVIYAGATKQVLSQGTGPLTGKILAQI